MTQKTRRWHIVDGYGLVFAQGSRGEVFKARSTAEKRAWQLNQINDWTTYRVAEVAA